MLWRSRRDHLLPICSVEQGHISTSSPYMCPQRRQSHIGRHELQKPISISRSCHRQNGKGDAYLVVTVKLKILLDLHRVWLGLGALCFYSLGDVCEDLLGSKHAVGIQTTVAVNLMSTSAWHWGKDIAVERTHPSAVAMPDSSSLRGCKVKETFTVSL